MQTNTSILEEIGKRARSAARTLAVLETSRKDMALHAIAYQLDANRSDVLAANDKDIRQATENGLDEALLDRLRLTEQRMDALADSVREVVKLDDPVGRTIERRTLPNGLKLTRRRVPIGVIGAIYEARPNVTIDIASLCLKTGNACILRGGKETLHSNLALARVISSGLTASGLPGEAVQIIEKTDRSLVSAMLRLDRYIDLIIPRGGEGLHRRCREDGSIPVITGGMGICHVFVDGSADLSSAVDIVENAKVQRPSVCNALDTLLVHEQVAEELLPVLSKRLAESNVEIRADDRAIALLKDVHPAALLRNAASGDFDREWLSLVLGIRVVGDIEQAIDHIERHGTRHSDSILTRDDHNKERFLAAVDSAAVYANASTRFTDGGEFGLGAEVAVSTQKLHARGPMGLESLTTYKWIGEGDGQVRA